MRQLLLRLFFLYKRYLLKPKKKGHLFKVKH